MKEIVNGDDSLIDPPRFLGQCDS